MKGPQKIGAYTVLSAIGRGGMGAVYKVEKDNITYALKTILPDQVDMNGLARFEREALAAAAVDKHPNIVSVHKLELNAQPPFIVMDYVEGKSLNQFIKEGESWPREKVIELLEPLAHALDHMHSKGVIHRDLKPANILIRDHDGAPMITDFGIAREASLETLTKTGEILGTPEYMAPEQLDNAKSVSPETDIWSLAIISFELLTGGKKPFHATSLFQLAESLLYSPPDLSPLDEHPDKRDRDVLAKALQKEPDKRYSSASQFCQAFQLKARALPAIILPILLGLVVLVLLTFLFLNSDDVEKPRVLLSKEELTSLDTKIDKFQREKLAEHFYQHLCQEQLGSKVPRQDCETLKRLFKEASSIIRLAEEQQQKSPSLMKVIRRWDPFLTAAASLEKIKELKAPQGQTDLARLIRAYKAKSEAPSIAAQELRLAPDHAQWTPSWLLIKATLAQRQKQFRKMATLYEELQTLSPDSFPFQSRLWLARAKVAESKSLRNQQLLFRALFYYWKYKKSHPEFKMPRSVQFGTNAQGQLDVQKLNVIVDELQLKKYDLAFRINLEATDHGIYLDSLDSDNLRTSRFTLKLIKENLALHPNKPSALFWAAYAPPFHRSERSNEESTKDFIQFQSDIKKALALPQPEYCKALLLARRAALFYEQEVHNPSGFKRKETVQKCLDDIEQAFQLHHPKPHELYWLKHKVLRRLYTKPEQLEARKEYVFKALDNYLDTSKALVQKTRAILNDSLALSENRPLEMPLARSVNYGIQTNFFKAFKARTSIYVTLKDWNSAEETCSKALKYSHDPLLAAHKIQIHEQLGQFKKLIEFKENLKELCQKEQSINKRDKDEYRRLMVKIDSILRQKP